MAASGQPTSYSCKCLNVQLKPLEPPSSNNSPEDVGQDGFTSIYVAESGIDIAHTQLTLRNRGPRFQRTEGQIPKTIRYILLTCLVCQTVVYRISQIVLPEVDGGEGPVLPRDDWAESEILQGTDGWIQVSNDCLSGQAIEQVRASPTYSKLFRIVLPPAQLEPSGTESYYVTPPARNPEVPSTPRSILPYIPTLFPPPPFTPSHPVFVHLSALAAAESEKLRADAEEQLRKIVDEKVAQLKEADVKLKMDVESIWSTFKTTVASIEDASARGQLTSRPRRSSGKHSDLSASVRVNDFVPSAAPHSRASVAMSAPTVSALSASLATTSFHQAMASHNGSSTREETRAQSSSRSSTIRTASPSTASSHTLGLPINGEAEIRDAYRRNMDESLDVATSFKYMMDIGAHVQSREPEVPVTVPEEDETNVIPSPNSKVVPRGRSPRAGKSAIKKPKPEVDTSAITSKDTPQPEASGKSSVPDVPTTPKSKRKVTFDVKPDVTIIATETPKVNGGKRPKTEEAVFDMENEDTEDEADVPTESSPAPSQPETPVAEPVQSQHRHPRRHASWSGLPSSFSSLRPVSLPLPSAVRPPPRVINSEDRSRPQGTREMVLSPADSEVKWREIEEPRRFKEEEEVMDPHEAEILKLVAASTPSHRSAWKKDSSAWRTFVARQKSQKSQKHQRSSSIPEEDEGSATDGPGYYDESGDDSGQDSEPKDFWSNDTSIARSLPIPIGPLGGSRRTPGPASFQPKAIVEKSGTSDKVSSAAMRRASYAERDRRRLLDPGALDFTTEEDDLDEEDEDLSKSEAAVGPRSLQRALKILQKRSEIPGDGMWRSLA
ncbi:hypothetical protein BDY19DRAFT_993374 [Irpex rosettiformis]|uniref:Uncharacterized protein n=1 Tax=Irpex rosettiformis TaxID=378272 RepID=A0ACB8U432_9APHY|nr:hypothetical protein BDY19DRAFT_993374 [Irpex rosettiformis]